MDDKYLHRGDAPVSEGVWKKIDETVVAAARSQLTARRLLHVDGPYGLGLKSIPGPDLPAVGGEGGAEVVSSGVVPVLSISDRFTLPVRDIANFEQYGLVLDLGGAARAAMRCARKEDDLLFNGSRELGVSGLLAARGVQSSKLKPWTEVGTAAEDIMAAINKLDAVGCHGPYTMALTPERYNVLFRRYPQGPGTELEHVSQMVAEGIVKAPALASGGVLLAAGVQFAAIILGQDLVTGFVGPSGGDYEFRISESLALRLVQPEAVCVLK